MGLSICEECNLEKRKCGPITYIPELKKHLCDGCEEILIEQEAEDESL